MRFWTVRERERDYWEVLCRMYAIPESGCLHSRTYDVLPGLSLWLRISGWCSPRHRRDAGSEILRELNVYVLDDDCSERSWEMDVKSWPPKEEAQLQPVDFSRRSSSAVSFGFNLSPSAHDIQHQHQYIGSGLENCPSGRKPRRTVSCAWIDPRHPGTSPGSIY